MKFRHSHVYPIKVQFEDVDFGGVVHHPNYLKFLERGRCDALVQVGYPFSECIKDGFCCVVADLRAKYGVSIRYDQDVFVVSRLVAAKRASLRVAQVIIGSKPSAVDLERVGDNIESLNNVLFAAQVRLVCVGMKELKPMEFPARMKEAMCFPRPEDLRLHPDWGRVSLSDSGN